MVTAGALDGLEAKIQDFISRRDYIGLRAAIDGHHSDLPHLQGRILLARGILAAEDTHFSEALIHFLNGLKIIDTCGAFNLEAQLHVNIGTVYARLHHLTNARDKYEYVISQYLDNIDDRTKAALYHNLGLLEYHLKDWKSSILYLNKAKDLFQELCTESDMILAEVLLHRSKIRSGYKELNIDINFYASIDRYITFNKALSSIQKGDVEQAIIEFKRSLQLATEASDNYLQIESIEEILKALKEIEQYEDLAYYYERLIDVRDALGDRQEEARLVEQEVNFKTKAKEKEIELLRIENALKNEIEKRNQKLQVANEDLRQFAYVVSHDLKEPLRMIGGFSQLIEHAVKPKIEKQHEEYFTFVKDGVERLGLLLDELSKLSTLRSLMDDVGPIELDELLSEVQSQISISIKESNAQIVIDAPIEIVGSRTLISSCLQNVIHNAIKYCADDVEPRIDVIAKKVGNQSVIQITDNGIGIPEDQQDRAFVIFQRIGKRTEKTGTGMGLAIAKRICQLHDGSIRIVESSKNGTTFEVRLTDQIQSTFED